MPRGVPGWTRVPKDHPGYKARHYLDPEGNERTRREYDNVRLQGYGFSSKTDYDTRFSRDDWYRIRLELWAERQEVSIKEARKASSPFNALYKQARDEGFSTDPNGALASLLVAAGLRDPDFAGNVGDS